MALCDIATACVLAATLTRAVRRRLLAAAWIADPAEVTPGLTHSSTPAALWSLPENGNLWIERAISSSLKISHFYLDLFSHLFLWHMLKTNLVHIRQCRAKPRNPVFTYEETNTSSKLPEKVTSCELQFFVNQKYSTFREQFVYYRVRSAVVLSVNLYIRYARTHKGRRSKLQPEHFKSFSTLVLAERSRFFNLARFRALAPQYV